MKSHTISFSSLLAVCLSTPMWAATESTIDFDGEINAGIMHNSALSVDELDNISSDSDSGREFGVALNANWKASKKIKLSTGYALKQQSYNKFSQFDLTLHQINANASYQFDKHEVGIRVDAARAKLAGDTFLDFTQASAYHGVFLQPQTYLRSSIKQKTKSFVTLQERDASGFGASTDLFHFINNANTMFMFGLNVEKENANEKEFTYTGIGFSTKVTHKLEIFGLGSQLGLNWRFQTKDYETPELTDTQQSIAQQRDENRHVVQASWTITLVDNLILKTELERGDYNSKIDRLTYEQNIAKVGMSYRF